MLARLKANRFSSCLKQNLLRSFQRSWASMAVKVEVKQGILVGKEGRLPNGNKYQSFQGIPYAVPPLGELRFKSPVPLERFPEPELDCTAERDVCHQPDLITQTTVGSENGLHLNVYAPQAMRSTSAPLPVMVWIHGGGFLFGSGNSEYYFPQRLMQEDVIVVTCNYRLGALGFLCLPEAGIWGNAGLKDQRLVLQWVHENIAQFNGDPNNVTLFGESAGAAAVHLHMYADHAHRLFHKAIMQSGTANMEWVFQVNSSFKTRRLSELLGCTANEPKEILRFLQSKEVTPEALLKQNAAVLTPEERRRGLPFAYKVVIEEPESPDRFVDGSVLEVLQRKDVVTMPTILGYNSAEGLTMTVNAVKKLKQIDEDLGRFLPRNIDVPVYSAEEKELIQKMRKFYFGDRAVSPETLNELTDLLGDYHFIIDLRLAAEKHVCYQPRSPLYFYRFNYSGKRDFYKRMFQLEHLRGSCHADELFYLFQMASEEQEGDAELTPSDALMAQRFAKLWSNFAKYGNPTPSGQIEEPLIPCEWTPVPPPKHDTDNIILHYLDIGKDLRMATQPDHERIQFWRQIYSIYKPIDYIDYNPEVRAKL